MTAVNKLTITGLTDVIGGIDISTKTNITAPSDWRASGRFLIHSMAYGNGKCVFFATSGSFPYNQVVSALVTTDMVNFTTATLPSDNNSGQAIAGVGCYNLYALGYFLHLNGDTGNGTTSTKISYSTDGITWNTATLPSASWQTMATDGSKVVAIDGFTSTLAYSSSITGTWTTGTGHTTGNLNMLVYGNGIWFLAGYSNQLTAYTSTTGIGSWSAVTLPAGATSIFFINGKFVILTGTYDLYYSSTAATGSWTRASLPTLASYGNGTMFMYNGMMYIANAGTAGPIIASDNFTSWYPVTLTGDTNMRDTSGGTYPYYQLSSCLIGSSYALDFSALGFVPIFRQVSSGSTMTLDFSKGNIVPGNFNGTAFYVDVTATNGTITSGPKRVFIRKSQTANAVYDIQAFPGVIALTSTSDGVIYPSELPATSVFTLYKNGVVQSGWTYSTVNSSGLTATISSDTLSVTAMSVDTGSAVIQATKPNEPTQTITVAVKKVKAGAQSGVQGSSYSAFATTQTSIYLKFLTTGYFQIKYGSGGTYTNAGYWYNPPNASSAPGPGYYLNVSFTSSTGDTLTATSPALLNSWQNITADREYIMTSSGAGTHLVTVQVGLSASSTGQPAVLGSGTLRIDI